MGAIAVIGGATALFAATIGIAQNDIKKVLAYSTVSQLGYMFAAVGVGAYAAGVFHLMTHAFFKACLFLGSGSVIHAMGGEQDMRKMGSLRHKMPITFVTFMAATLAIAGVPPFAGFMSKDEIIWQAFAHGHTVVWAMLLIGAGITVFYMFRQVYMTFFGEFRGTHEQEHHLHESPPSMTIPLVVLAALSAVAGFVGVPAVISESGDRLGAFLAPVFPKISAAAVEGAAAPLAHGTEWLLLLASTAVAAGGVLLGLKWYAAEGGRMPARIAASMPGVYALVRDKFRVDELYDALFVRPFEAIARVLWKVVDVLIIDGILNAGAFLVELAGDLLRFIQTGNVRNYALTFFLGVVALMLLVLGAF
jgi:NADH-quinone oxidoreductase subunit L